MDPQSRSHFGGCWCWPGLPSRWGRVGATLEGLARAGGLSVASPQGNSRASYTVLASMLKSDRNGSCQHWVSQVEAEWKNSGAHQYTYPQRKFHQIPATLSTWPKVSQSISFLYDPDVFQAATLHRDSTQVSLCTSSSRIEFQFPTALKLSQM